MKAEEVDQKYSAPAVVQAFEILTFLGKPKNKKSTLTEISNGTGLNRSTCYRILQTLVTLKILLYNEETKKFSLGPYLIVLGNRASDLIDYMTIANDYMVKISRLSESTCSLIQRIGDEWVYIEKTIPNSPLSISINVGQRFSLNAGASGKLFLAYMPEEERNGILDRIGLKKYTQYTTIERDKYISELAGIRNQGYAVSVNEHIEGITGLSFPIENKLGELEFVITVFIISHLKKEENFTQLINEIKQITKELSSFF
ncbi:IclR family transcriptional regulator [Neobacillus rhizophilus]|uniref:IclR family transcriptional regulator n=1 Tax=Neobacillus rhizophilus TaxID=2833579 RepID=A0A942YTI8_9BACI|nr:IclR family transcriptional regulator [Neobacillus rhizophilus]MBS4210975.1 IclR family transcriptional regulator [Neobacillus rhizophilus]MBU8917475.1 IclR family transcriptional regulator [Bacillus sp. FJAT-29953]